jgi:cell division cycle 14
MGRRKVADRAVDDQMAYCPFSRDYGPLNLAFTYSACLALHDKMNVSCALS